jgi:hypothetical protein
MKPSSILASPVCHDRFFAPLALCAFALFCPLRLSVAEGLPEPGLVMYGTVVNTFGGANARLTSGRLIWTIQPAAGGAAITLTNDLANINGQFSYILRVPFESLVGSATLSPNTLRLNTTRTTYVRSGITLRVDGVPNPIPVTNVAPALPAFDFGASDRGRLEQVNLQVAFQSLDSDHDGIPDSWMMKYFGHATGEAGDKSRAQDDPDDDSMKNWEEYIAGTDPKDDTSFLAITRLLPDGQSARDLVEWSSASNRLYSVYGSPTISDSLGNFSLIASNIVGNPPRNTFTNTLMPSARFYKVQVFKVD